MYVVFPCISARGYFQDLTHDLMVTRQQLYHCTRATSSICLQSVCKAICLKKYSYAHGRKSPSGKEIYSHCLLDYSLT
jgi:hypothetical protein